MKRRFVICVDDSTVEQQNKITNFLKDIRVGYWHWFSDLWLVTDPFEEFSASDLRDKINNIIPGAHKIVIQIDGETTWSAYGKKDSFKWLHETWSDE